jgi:succinyl-CoA synthetase alpha subunit
MEELRPDTTGIYVAAHQATGAIEEAIEAEVPLIVAVAEHIPLHDMLRVRLHSFQYNDPGATTDSLRVDTLDPQDAVQDETGRTQLTWNHLSYWKMSNRFQPLPSPAL